MRASSFGAKGGLFAFDEVPWKLQETFELLRAEPSSTGVKRSAVRRSGAQRSEVEWMEKSSVGARCIPEKRSESEARAKPSEARRGKTWWQRRAAESGGTKQRAKQSEKTRSGAWNLRG